MTAFRLTAIAATLVVASASTWAKTPDQRALELALSIADKAASQQPKAAVADGATAATAAVKSGVTSATTKGAK
jgi:hypothetical protein